MRLLPAVLLPSVLSWLAFGQTYTISTFAGGGLPVNIPGTAASLRFSNFTDGVATDSAGNVFITIDAFNCVVRLDATTRLLTLAAGNGTPGFSGDNGPATNAQLNNPRGVAVDSAGNLYIADNGNNRVRKVSNGVITTIAGNGGRGFSGDNGPAASAQLNFPTGVAVDSAGNLYIADYDNERIRRVSNGVINTVAGNGMPGFSGDNGPATNAQLSNPVGIAVDSAGNLYVADTGNYRVRRVSNGVITTVAGNGTRGFSGDGGPATSAQFDGDQGVAVDSAGNLYIADDGNYRIRKVSNGVITTVAGNGTPGFSGDNGPATSAQLNLPDGVALDSAGNLYIVDLFNNRIRKVSGGGITTAVGGGSSLGDNGPAVSSQLAYPSRVAVDSAGNLYIADYGDNRIRRVSDSVITTVAGNGTQGFSGDNGPATSARLNDPDGVAVDSAGTLYIADTDNFRVRKTSNGVITTIAGNGTQGFSGDNGPATSAQLNAPGKLAVDSASDLFMADYSNFRIRKVSNGVIATVAGNGTIGFSGDNGPATNAQLNGPSGLAVDSTGNIYIADYFNQRIRKVSNGVITTVAGNGTQGFSGDNGPATSAHLDYPYGIAVDSAGNLYIGDSGNFRVRKVSNGVITTAAGNGTQGFSGDNGPATSAQFYFPGDVVVDSSGNVYVADQFNQRIRLLTPTGSSCTCSVAPTILQAPAAGGNLTVTIQTTASCAWAIQSLPQWITYSGDVVRTGATTLTLVVAANSGVARTTIISIAGFSVPVTQQGAIAAPSVNAVASAASYAPNAVSPGEIVVLFGSGLGPAELALFTIDSAGNVDTQLAGTAVSFNGTSAPIIYTSATQVAAIVPYGISGTSAQVILTYQGQTSAAVTVNVVPSVPGLFTSDSSGTGQAAAVNQDGSINGGGHPAPIGSVISLYATGEGPTSPAGVDGKPAQVPLPRPLLPVTVTIGGQILNPQYAGGAPGEVAGVMQINVQIPSGITPGNAVPVVIQVGSATSPSGVTIAVAGN